MPLQQKALNKLLKDLLAYREEQGWVDKDITTIVAQCRAVVAGGYLVG